MKITISQQELPAGHAYRQAGRRGKKIDVEFRIGKLVDKFVIDKADGFINVLDRVVKLWQSRLRRLKCCKQPKFYYPVDKFLKKSDNTKNAIAKASFEFANVGILTERIIRAIIAGLRF